MSEGSPQDAEGLAARAREFATEAHARIDHRRKYTGQPYQEHLKAVAELVSEVTDDPEVLAAAWLHDTVEDTTATFGDIERNFGRGVMHLVVELTDVSRPVDGNRAERKALDLRHLSQASPRAQTIKLADLIDNCRDICRHDPAFARVYLVEANALLGVLTAGHPRLYERANRTVATHARRLGLPLPSPRVEMDDSPLLSREGSHAQRRMRRLFTAAFTAQDVAEPLRSFDIDCSAEDIASILQSHGLPVAALRRDRLCAGYAREAQLVRGCAGDVMRPFASGQLLPGDSPLSAVIEVLSRYDFCFVTALGDVQGVVTRSDIQKPVVRMWLFGIVTLIEMDLGARVRRTWPDGAWVRLLSRARLEKAQALLDERQRRGQRPELLDCLQLTDKASILMQD